MIKIAAAPSHVQSHNLVTQTGGRQPKIQKWESLTAHRMHGSCASLVCKLAASEFPRELERFKWQVCSHLVKKFLFQRRGESCCTDQSALPVRLRNNNTQFSPAEKKTVWEKLPVTDLKTSAGSLNAKTPEFMKKQSMWPKKIIPTY